MENDAKRSDARALAGGGAVLCALATLFTWSQLAISPEHILTLAAFVATAIGLSGRPRRWPELGVTALALCAVAAGGWFGAGAYFGLIPTTTFHPLPLMIALGLSLAGVLTVVLTRWREAHRDEARASQLIYALVAVALIASAVVYHQLFTVGFAEDMVARRIVITLVWLAAGLAMIVRGNHHQALRNGGRIFVAAAYLKALGYDTTHLDGVLRIVALLATGGLLLGAAWALDRRRQVEHA